jgi:N-acetylmuramoyl-L-alanine amidase
MRSSFIAIALILVLLTGGLLSFDNERLVVFGKRGRVEAETFTENGVTYVNLGGVLLSESEFSTKAVRDGLRYELAGRRIDAHAGARDVRADSKVVKVDAGVVIRGDQAWVPTSNIAEVVRTALKKPAQLRGGRLLIGDAGDYITTEYRPGEPSTVILHFHEPVNPVIDTSEEGITLAFSKEPVVMNTAKVEYEDKTLDRLEFSESAGAAQITVHGSVPLMARFEDDNRRIVITAAPSPVAGTPPPPATTATAMPENVTPEANAPAAAQPPSAGPADAARPGIRTAVVAIDPTHGGNDAGVKFSEKLLEKNVSLAIAEKLKAELNNRGISTIMLRSGDDDVNPDDRAEAANAARVSYYIAIHAGQIGSGVRVFTPLRVAASITTDPLFKPWDQVQADQLEESARFAAGLGSQFAEKKIPVRQLGGNTAPLAHVSAAAVSIEVAPERNDESSLESVTYIQKIAQAVATAVAQEKSRQ